MDSFALAAALVALLHWLAWPVLAALVCLGLLALVSPNQFARFASRSSTWVDTSKLVAKMDAPIDVDQHVMRHSRLFGLAVVIGSVLLGYLYYTRVLGSPGWFS